MTEPRRLTSLEENWKSEFKVGEILTGKEVLLTGEEYCDNQRGNVQRCNQVKLQ
jgi:hypothetical protein